MSNELFLYHWKNKENRKKSMTKYQIAKRFFDLATQEDKDHRQARTGHQKSQAEKQKTSSSQT